MRGSSCITCGHHPPGPRAAGSSGTGTLYQKQSKHRHINRVEVGVGDGVGVKVGEVDGESGLKEKFIKGYLISAFLLMALDVLPRKVVGDGELDEYNA
jgi:hypothetical protein